MGKSTHFFGQSVYGQLIKSLDHDKMVLKNFPLGKDVFEEVVFDNLEAKQEKDKKRWNIYAYPLSGQFETKDKTNVELFGSIFACSFSRVARYTPSRTNKLTSKIVSQSAKANL